MEKVIPPGINYADIKPEAIENQIKILKFTPAKTGLYLPNEGNGFFDPYSAYLKFKINLNTNTFSQINVNNQDRVEGLHLDRSGHSIINRMVVRSQGQELERIEEYDVLAAMINDVLYSQEQKVLHHHEGFGTYKPHNGADASMFFQQAGLFESVVKRNHFSTMDRWLGIGDGRALQQLAITPFDDLTFMEVFDSGRFQVNTLVHDGINLGALQIQHLSQTSLWICIPIYSGIIGVLMPDKKLLPLSLIPLEVEFTINPHAMYSMPFNATDPALVRERDFYITNVELYAHVLFFEQELHRSLEAVVAEHGIFIHFNTFRQAPVTANTGGANQGILSYAQINSHAKSINSVHWVFIYDTYLSNPTVKKLQFQTHQVTSIQIRNGTELWPSEPIVGSFANGPDQLGYTQFLVEMYKAWGKLHDPTTDACLNQFNYCLDQLQEVDVQGVYPVLLEGEVQQYGVFPGFFRYAQLRSLTPSCQYGVSFEGEQLGTEKTTITGKRGLIPFDINIQGTKRLGTSSFMIIFVRADYILYVRPDLVVTRLGD